MSTRTLRWTTLAGILGALAAVQFGSTRGANARVSPSSASEAFLQTKAVGRQSDGSVVVSTNQQIRPVGTQIEFLGRPMAVALHPNGKTATFLNGYHKALIVIDTQTAQVIQEFSDVGSSASFGGLVYDATGTKLYASQASGVVVAANVAADGTLSLDSTIKMPASTIPYPGREDRDPYPGGLALSADGKVLYVALSRNNSVAVVDLASKTVVAEVPVGNAPHDLLLSGNRLYVSNQGGREATHADFTVDSSGTRIVADAESGFAKTGTVSVIDLTALRTVRDIEVGLAPTAMVANQSTLFVANTNSDSVSAIDLASDKVVRTLSVRPYAGAALGSSPNALALTPQRQLLVSLGRSNAIAVLDIGELRQTGSSVTGLIPTAWYPTSLVVDAVTRRIIVANGKGVGSLGPNATVGPDPATNKTGHYVHSYQGSASILDMPDRRQLSAYTQSVFENNGWDRVRPHDEVNRERAKPAPIPAELGEPSVFKHVFYIIKENRTYDQIYGDLQQGNGDPNLVQFGRDVTPNHHALAEQFALLDNMYDCGSNSADGHQWSTQANAPDYIEKAFGGFTRTYPFNGGDSLVYLPTRFLWDNALRQNKSVRVYGEYINGLSADGVEMGPWTGTFLGHGVTDAGVWGDFYNDSLLLAQNRDYEVHVNLLAHTEIPSLQRVLSESYPPYNQIVPDQYRTEIFLKEFAHFVKHGNLPNLVIVALTNDHTQGTTPDYPTPRAMVADNDLALGRIVDAIAHSRYWKDSVIFVTEDDAQNGVDHVDGHRTIGLVISAYSKRKIVSSNYYTQLNMIRSMEQILGLYPMNVMDGAVDPHSMASLFGDKPNLEPYKFVPNVIPLNELNPGSAELTGLAKDWATVSSTLDFSAPDCANEAVLNRAIWYSTKGYDRPYPGDKRVLRPEEAAAFSNVESDDD